MLVFFPLLSASYVRISVSSTVYGQKVESQASLFAQSVTTTTSVAKTKVKRKVQTKNPIEI